MSNDSEKLPGIAVAAVVFAFLSAVANAIAGFHTPPAMVIALVPAWAGIGILLRRTWSAYGFALYQLASLSLLPLALKRTDKVQVVALAATSIGSAGICVVFLLAGRWLARSGAKRGFAWPWIVLALVQTVPFIFLRAYVLPSASMENTMIVGDQFLVQEFPKPRLSDGDLVVFRFPVDRRQIFTKRVIGVAGDRIRIASRIVYRNGSVLPESYVIHKLPEENRWRDNFPPNPSETPPGLDDKSVTAVQEMLRQNVLQGECS